jgi:hypothetical protein
VKKVHELICGSLLLLNLCINNIVLSKTISENFGSLSLLKIGECVCPIMRKCYYTYCFLLKNNYWLNICLVRISPYYYTI